MSPQGLERFQREARSASALNHPNICTIYDVGTDPPFIAMELLEGVTLYERLTRGPMETTAIVDIALATPTRSQRRTRRASSIATSNPRTSSSRRVVPKCSTSGWRKQWRTSLGDESQSRETELLLTEPGGTVGTLSYMSPEQIRELPLDGRTDLFSLGVVLYEMATGVRPFHAESRGLIVDAILNRAPIPPSQLNARVPSGLEVVINRCLQKERHLRYQQASEIHADLQRVKSGDTGDGSRPEDRTSLPQSDRRGHRTPRRTALVATSAAVLAVLTGACWYTSAPRATTHCPRRLHQHDGRSRVRWGAPSRAGGATQQSPFSA